MSNFKVDKTEDTRTNPTEPDETFFEAGIGNANAPHSSKNMVERYEYSAYGKYLASNLKNCGKSQFAIINAKCQIGEVMFHLEMGLYGQGTKGDGESTNQQVGSMSDITEDTRTNPTEPDEKVFASGIGKASTPDFSENRLKNPMDSRAKKNEFSVLGENIAVRLRDCGKSRLEIQIAQCNIAKVLVKLQMGFYNGP